MVPVPVPVAVAVMVVRARPEMPRLPMAVTAGQAETPALPGTAVPIAPHPPQATEANQLQQSPPAVTVARAGPARPGLRVPVPPTSSPPPSMVSPPRGGGGLPGWHPHLHHQLRRRHGVGGRHRDRGRRYLRGERVGQPALEVPVLNRVDCCVDTQTSALRVHFSHSHNLTNQQLSVDRG